MVPTKRSCGECSLCCTTHGVPAINKSIGEKCKFQHDQPLGCSIYANRPLSCRNYKCAQLEGLAPDDAKPSVTGIVIDSSTVSLFGAESPLMVWLLTAVEGSQHIELYAEDFIRQRPGDIARLRMLTPQREETWWFPSHLSEDQQQEVRSRF